MKKSMLIKNFTLKNLIKQGYIRVPRKVFELYYSGDPDAKMLAELYLYLYSQSYFKTGHVEKNGLPLTCERGQIICSQAEMAQVVGCTKKMTVALLEELKELDLIEVEIIERISHIGILYYDKLAGMPQELKPELTEKEKKRLHEKELAKQAAKENGTANEENSTRMSYKNYGPSQYMKNATNQSNTEYNGSNN